jgi:hypothetical protein
LRLGTERRVVKRVSGGGSSSAVEHLLAKEGVASSNLVFRSKAEVAELVDATVSKTVERRLSCRFDPGLRHHLTLTEQGGKMTTPP